MKLTIDMTLEQVWKFHESKKIAVRFGHYRKVLILAK